MALAGSADRGLPAKAAIFPPSSRATTPVMKLLPAIATVGGYTMVSRVLGFVRDIMIAAFLGAGMVADAFFVAFKLPNFFRRLFAEGAFNAGFVPIFSEILEQDGREAAREFAQSALAVLVVALVLLVGLFQAFMPWLMYGLAPGFVDWPEKFDLTVQLTRITFPYLLFISVVSLMGGVLNSVGRFAAVAATPILLNLCLIGALLGLARYTDTPGHALAWGVALAGMVQFIWVVWALRRAGMTLRFPRPRFSPRVKHLLTLMAPAAVGAGVVQINLVIDVVLASLLPSGSVSYLFYADRLNQLPLGVVGVAVGTALLPLISREISAGRADAALGHQNRATEFALLLALPAAAAFIVLAHPFVSTLFERGAFGSRESDLTALALMAYAIGLPAYVLVKVLSPAYFARQDTATPVRIAALCVVVNLILNLALMWWLKHVGLALATALSAWLNCLLLARTLSRRGDFVMDQRLRKRLPLTLLSTLIMAIGLGLLHVGLEPWLAGSLLDRVMAVVALASGGVGLFACAAYVTGAARLHDLRAFRLGS